MSDARANIMKSVMNQILEESDFGASTRHPEIDWSKIPDDVQTVWIEPAPHYHSSLETRFRWTWASGPGVIQHGEYVEVPIGIDFRECIYDRVITTRDLLRAIQTLVEYSDRHRRAPGDRVTHDANVLRAFLDSIGYQ